MTLRPEPYSPEAGGLLRGLLGMLSSSPLTAWVTFDLVEFCANVAMFVPLGVLAMLWGGRGWHGILAGAVLSAAIEVTQLLLLPTRVADVRDIVANTAGAALGVAVIVMTRRRRRLHSERIASAIESS